MLLKKIIRYYWFIGLLIYTVFMYAAFRSTDFIYLYITSFATYLLYGVVITVASYQRDSFFSKINLVSIVFIYSIIMVGMFHTLSYIVDGDTFLFSKIDAMDYYRYSLQYSELETSVWFNKLQHFASFDDWGAFFWMVPMFKLIPTPQFVSFTYCILGTITALILFNIGRNLMPRRYAYLAALAFSTASFVVVLHSTFLKESVMICIIIASFNFFYGYLRNGSLFQLILAFIFAGLILLYRVPVCLILMLSYIITIILIYSKKPIVFVSIVATSVLAISVLGSKYILYTYKGYLSGGDVELIIERKNSLARDGGVVNQLADPIAAIVGPFPGIVAKTINRNTLNAPGLLFRCLIAFSFILGTYYIVKERRKNMYPLIIFFWINVIGIAISSRGLEFRLSYPHIFIVYLVAFWMLARFDYHKIRKQLSIKLFYASMLCVLVICILWNMRGV